MTEAKAENLMAGTWTKAAKVRRAFKAGPRRKTDLVYHDIEEAVLNGYAAFLTIRKEMHMPETLIPEGDVKAALVLMSSTPESNAGLVSLLSFPRTIKNLSEMSSKAERLAKKGAMVPLGVAFWLRDREADDPKKGKATWVQPWLVNPRAARAAIAAQKAFEESDGQDTNDTFGEI
jgi:hypothetical protein